MAGIQTSNITTSAANDLTIQPAAGKKTLLKSVTSDNPGVTPVATASDGEIKKFLVSDLTDIGQDAADDDVMLIQDVSDGNKVKKILASEVLGGGNSFLDPDPGDITAVPPFLGGNGSIGSPYVLTPGLSPNPGDSIQSVQTCTVVGPDGSLVLFSDISAAPAQGKYNQNTGVVAGGSYSWKFDYRDTPVTALGDGQVYNGLITLGSVYFTWDVTQIANKTNFNKNGVSTPNASPDAVNLDSQLLYGVGEAPWQDSSPSSLQTDSHGSVDVDNAIDFAVEGRGFGESANINTGEILRVRYKQSLVDAALEGSTIGGQIINAGGYKQYFSFIKDITPNAFVFPGGTGAPATTIYSAAITPVGYNATATVSLSGSTFTSAEVSVGGGAYTSSNTTIYPGQNLVLKVVPAAGSDGDVQSVTVTVGNTSAVYNLTIAGAVIPPVTIDVPTDGLVTTPGNQTYQTSAFDMPAQSHQDTDWEIFSADLSNPGDIGPIISPGATAVVNADFAYFYEQEVPYGEIGPSFARGDIGAGYSCAFALRRDKGVDHQHRVWYRSSIDFNWNKGNYFSGIKGDPQSLQYIQGRWWLATIVYPDEPGMNQFAPRYNMNVYVWNDTASMINGDFPVKTYTYQTPVMSFLSGTVRLEAHYLKDLNGNFQLVIQRSSTSFSESANNGGYFYLFRVTKEDGSLIDSFTTNSEANVEYGGFFKTDCTSFIANFNVVGGDYTTLFYSNKQGTDVKFGHIYLLQNLTLGGSRQTFAGGSYGQPRCIGFTDPQGKQVAFMFLHTNNLASKVYLIRINTNNIATTSNNMTFNSPTLATSGVALTFAGFIFGQPYANTATYTTTISIAQLWNELMIQGVPTTNLQATISHPTHETYTSQVKSINPHFNGPYICGNNKGLAGDPIQIQQLRLGTSSIPVQDDENMSSLTKGAIVEQIGGVKMNQAAVLDWSTTSNPPTVTVTGPPDEWEISAYLQVSKGAVKAAPPKPAGDVPSGDYTLFSRDLASSDLTSKTYDLDTPETAYYAHAKHRSTTNTESDWSDWHLITVH